MTCERVFLVNMFSSRTLFLKVKKYDSIATDYT